MSILSYIKSHVFVASVTGTLIVVVAVIGGRAASRKPVADATLTPTKVTTVNAASFRKGNVNVIANGVVESHSQADLKSQTSAPIATVDVAIGDAVYAGEVLMELQNTDIRAQLDSAKASQVLAEGQYASSRKTAVDKVRDAYLVTDNAVSSVLDPLISSDIGKNPPLYAYYMTDPELGNKIRDERVDVSNGFDAWKKTVDGLSATSSDSVIYAALLQSQKNVDLVTKLLNDVSTALSTASRVSLQSDLANIATLQSGVNGARTAVSGASSNLTSAETALMGAQTSSGGSAATAQLDVASANIKNLEAQLAKTVIRSPISGKVASMPLRVGELASAGTLLATVVGDTSKLEVKANVSADDLSRLKAGQAATIQGGIAGIVSNVAPSVDELTRKAEVDIDVADSSASDLVIGQNVQVSIAAKAAIPAAQNGQPGVTGQTAASGQPTYIVPIQNVKTLPGSAYVFTVDADSKIKKNDVTLGQIQGDFVEVIGGMNDDMNIVAPVYELDEGQKVTVQ